MATLNYTNIETRVMNALRIPTTDATQQARVQALINMVYRDIGMKFRWWWRDKRAAIVTADDITAGTVSVTNNSTAVTFSSAPTPSVAQRWLHVRGNALDAGAIYRITTHVAGAVAATLSTVYTGATATAAAYDVWQDAYDLPTDFAHDKTLQRYGNYPPMRRVSPDEMTQMKGYDRTVGKPHWYTVLDFETTGDPTTQAQLIVHPFPDAIYSLELLYTQALNTELSGTTRPLIPDDYVEILVYGSLATGYPMFHKDFEAGAFFERKFVDMLNLMTSEHRQRTGETPRMQVDDQYRRFYRRGRRKSAATADLGSWFDRWSPS